MAFCGCLLWLVIVLLVAAGVAYLLGAESLGDLALDIIRLIIAVLLIMILIGLILILIGYIDLSQIEGIPFLLGTHL